VVGGWALQLASINEITNKIRIKDFFIPQNPPTKYFHINSTIKPKSLYNIHN